MKNLISIVFIFAVLSVLCFVIWGFTVLSTAGAAMAHSNYSHGEDEPQKKLLFMNQLSVSEIAHQMGWCKTGYKFHSSGGILIWYEYNERGECVSKARHIPFKKIPRKELAK